jgi:hypothetical protein
MEHPITTAFFVLAFYAFCVAAIYFTIIGIRGLL